MPTMSTRKSTESTSGNPSTLFRSGTRSLQGGRATHGQNRGLNFWGKLYQRLTDYVEQETAPSTIKVSGLEQDDDDVVTEQKQIVSMLMHAADHETTVEMAFGSRILTYKAKIEMELDEDTDIDVLSSEYLRHGRHILISVNDPEAIDKIRANTEAFIQFPQENKFNEFCSRMLEDVDGEEGDMNLDEEDRPHQFRMSFPETVFRKQQRRMTARFEVPGSAIVSLVVERPALVTFPAAILNIGSGGLSFMQPGDIAPLTENCHLNLLLNWQHDQELIIPGTLVKNMSSMGKTQVHVRFSVQSYEMSRALGELVAYIERFELTRRSDNRLTPAEDQRRESSFWWRDAA